MNNSATIKEFAERLRNLNESLFGGQGFASAIGLQLSLDLAKHHPFVGSLPVPGGGANRNFRLTGMIIESIEIVPGSGSSACVSLVFKDPDSYHKDFFLDKALEAAALKTGDELDRLLLKSGMTV